jgi:biotin synthase
MISYLIYKIKQEYDVEITLDLLERGFDEYRAWKFSGADNYLLKFNTSNSKNYSLFTQNNKLDERINHIKYLQRIGYKICTGNIIGLPYQSEEDISRDLLLLKSFKPEMILNTPFIPHELTKFKNIPKGSFQLLMKTTAISRLLMKKSQIIIAGSSNFFSLDEKKRLFSVGADTLMLEPLLNGNIVARP